MGRPRKIFLDKYCEVCGKKLERRRWSNGALESTTCFEKRKFCSVACSGKWASKTRLSIPVSSPKSSRRRARNAVPPAPCLICGKTGYTEVHHKDENPMNNSPDNLVRLCKSCHARQHRHRASCVVCGLPAKGHGLCTKHWQAWSKSMKRGWDTDYTKSIKMAMEEAKA